MDDTLPAQPTPEEVRKIEAALSEIFAEIERIDERIAKDQQETERLRIETRKKLAQLKAHLDYMAKDARLPAKSRESFD